MGRSLGRKIWHRNEPRLHENRIQNPEGKVTVYLNAYFHFSANPLILEPRIYDQSGLHHGFMKPGGLWFSVNDDDDGWRAWCEAEGFRLHTLQYKTEIFISSEAKICRISNKEELSEFGEKFAVAELNGIRDAIDWHKVGEIFDGIIIAPYIWECRLDSRFMWYYGWDCASGCIWNTKVISVKIDSETGQSSEITLNS